MLKRDLRITCEYLIAFAKWAVAGAAIGAICGLVGAVFAMAVSFVTGLRGDHPWLIYLLPMGGLAIAAMYRLFKLPISIGTDGVFDSVGTQEKVPVLMAPAIFVSTVLTHMLGGSAGREGAALQLGGSLGSAVGGILKPGGDGRRICQLCGMAAVFSALFGTPFTAAIFVIEVVDVGIMNYRALMPCVVSALTAGIVTRLIGGETELFPLAADLVSVNAVSLLQSAAIGIVCAAAAILFCVVMHAFSKYMPRIIKNDFLRIFVGGTAVIAMTLIVGSRDYNGGGMNVILSALEGNARWEAFLMKLLFTAVTLSAGYKGGEIVPSFFVGATLGCVFAPIVGFPAAAGAAVGMVCVFCGVTNAPIASLIIGAELFGMEYLPFIGLAGVICYMLSGRFSLYHAQSFAHPKLGEKWDGQ